jgi:hypothetical protein
MHYRQQQTWSGLVTGYVADQGGFASLRNAGCVQMCTNWLRPVLAAGGVLRY